MSIIIIRPTTKEDCINEIVKSSIKYTQLNWVDRLFVAGEHKRDIKYWAKRLIEIENTTCTIK